MKKALLAIVVLAVSSCGMNPAYAIQTITKPYTFSNGTKADANQVNADFDTVYSATNSTIGAINSAAGTRPTLQQYLRTSLNDDGTLKGNVTAGAEWFSPGLAATYLGSNQFTVSGDQTSIFLVNRRVKITIGTGTFVGEVTASSYSGVSGLTTVAVSIVVTNPITSVEVSAIRPVASGGSVTMKMISGGYDLSSSKVARTIPLSDTNGAVNADLVGNVTGNVTGNINGLSTGNASGNIPISNGTVNTNFNADMVDGYHAGNATGNVPISNGTVNTNLNADTLDGNHATAFATATGSTVAKAWVNFSAVGGTITIRKAYNVTSVTRNGAGDYTINFTNAMSDANYCVIMSSVSSGGTTPGFAAAGIEALSASNTYSTKTTNALRVHNTDLLSTGNLEEAFSFNAVIFD